MSGQNATNHTARAMALEKLKFQRTASRNNTTSSANASPPTFSSSPAPPYSTPPPQSRDATMSSRYFTPPSSGLGTVLVPDSSPLSTSASFAAVQGLQQHGQPFNPNAVNPNNFSYNGWNSPGSRSLGIDPLNAPTGFTSSFTHNARRPRADNDVADDDAPPRKRQNHGMVVPGSPESPAIIRNPRRKITALADHDSESDELPEPAQVLAGPSRPRIQRRPNSPSTPNSTAPNSQAAAPTEDDKRFSRFRMTNPMEGNLHRLRAAWSQANGDDAQATALLSTPGWNPPISAVGKAVKKEDPNKDADVVDAVKAQRAVEREKEREKAKKSLIYANRPGSKAIPTLTSQASTIPIATTSSQSIEQLRRPTRKKRVIASDSEPEVQSESEGDSSDERPQKRSRQENTDEMRALAYFNEKGPEALQELTGCTPAQAQIIIAQRPFESIEDLNTKLGQGGRKAGPGGISPRIFEDITQIFEGYGTVDSVLEECEEIGARLRTTIASWSSSGTSKTGDITPDEDGSVTLRSVSTLQSTMVQPASLAEGVQLKDYQILGVNWLNLLHKNKLSCILADEMGLGKTIQVISFLAMLQEKGNKGPHLVVVPSSTLENWCREFDRFAPSLSFVTYYGGKDERVALRQELLDTQRRKNKAGDGSGWDVLITTYNLAQGDNDRKFFRRIEWDSCIFDEGHVLKNFQSQRYQSLLKVESRWRLLLTGTPLQNNLQELVSLMNFILPDQFADALDSLRAIFKVKGDSKVSLLAQERVSRAKKMMTPFVLRRRKDQVLKDLPNKSERIEWCEMTPAQSTIYKDAVERSRKTIMETPLEADAPAPNGRGGKPKKGKAATKAKDSKMYLENSSNVLMDFRKAASHPMLFRRLFTDTMLDGITKQLMKEAEFKKRGALAELVKEDMTVMTDAELQLMCGNYKSTKKYLQDRKCYDDAGKVQKLLKLMDRYHKEKRKILIFSQFTQILDILKVVLKDHNMKYLLLTGSTPVDIRQSLVDEFTEDETITVFLLSTKAGGMGINLTAASVVIMFDQDFNPHNDRQAQDRAYRIGQKRDVEVVKLISKGTIEEDMLRLGETKLALDEAVAGEPDEKGESAPEREMKMSLMNALRQQFAKQEGGDVSGETSAVATPAP